MIVVIIIIFSVLLLGLLGISLPPAVTHSTFSTTSYSDSPSTNSEINSTATPLVTTANPPYKNFLNLYVNDTFFPLSEFSIMFVKNFSTNNYTSLKIHVNSDTNRIIVFYVFNCQTEFVHVNEVFSLHISLLNHANQFEITTAYYLRESILSYNIILPRTVNLTTSSDCLATLVTFDDLNLYRYFIHNGTWNNSQSQICINDYTITETMVFSENSYNFIGLHVSPGFSDNFTIDLLISGTAVQYNIHDIVRNSYGSCQIYTNIINECTITPSSTTAEKSEACVVGIVNGQVGPPPSHSFPPSFSSSFPPSFVSTVSFTSDTIRVEAITVVILTSVLPIL